MIRDPAGLLQRISELEPLCEEPRIRRAVETGNPFKVYRALVISRLLSHAPSHRAALDLLLRHRRLFARPIGRSPWLGTYNGFGATFLGSGEKDPDGSYVTNHFLVAFFAIPLFPLGAYPVARAESKGLRSAWHIFARVPLSTFNWLWGRAIALGILVLIAGGALKTLHAARYHPLHVVNGFRQPLRVTIGKISATIPGQSHQILEILTGAQQARAEGPQGLKVDAVMLDIPSGSKFIAWNIAGAAPVFRREVSYFSKGSEPDKHWQPSISTYCGQRAIEVPKVDDAFTAPPKEISMPKHSTSVSRIHVDLAGGSDELTSICYHWLGEKNQLDQALSFLESAARLSQWDLSTTYRAVVAAYAVNPVEAVRLAKQARDARPDDVLVHRTYQHIAAAAGHEEELLAEYGKNADASPDSPAAQYLYLRLSRGSDAAASAERLIQRFPDDPNILRFVSFTRMLASNWDGTKSAWQSLFNKAPTEAGHLLDTVVTALVALGRPADALSLMERSFEALDDEGRQVAVVLYARVAVLQGEAPPDKLLGKLDGKRPLLRARGGLPLEEEQASKLVELVQSASADPAKTLQLVSELKQSDLPALDDATWALAYGEAVRTDASEAAKSLERYPLLEARDLDLFRRFIRGEKVILADGTLNLVVRAAACFIRSRRSSLDARERSQLIGQAKRDDWLKAAVSKAIAQWTHPTAAR